MSKNYVDATADDAVDSEVALKIFIKLVRDNYGAGHISFSATEDYSAVYEDMARHAVMAADALRKVTDE